jgi:integrase/recombinase XerD
MWQELFHRSNLIARLAQGAWNPYLDEFVTFLQQQHYAVNTIRRAVISADGFAGWVIAQQIPLSDVSNALVTRYRQSLGRCEGGSWPHHSRSLPVVVKFLEHKQILIPHCALTPETPAALWLARFYDHLGHVAGLAASTIRQYQLTVERFLQERFADAEPDWSQLSAEDLSSFIKREAARRTGFGRKTPGVALRAFLRFLVAQGLVRDGLAGAIPTPRHYQHATLPDRATTEQVAAVLACCQDDTPAGRRDYSVLLLLARLGLRAHEVARLTFEDIDWHAGVLLVRPGKTRRERRLPLTQEVGAALADYIQFGRPASSTRRIFLQAQPPHKPWSGASAVSQLVHRRLVQSGYPRRPWRGAHLFRHTVASQMVNGGASFKDVADVLGHQSLATTSLYAKLDLKSLNDVAMPWPGGKQ